MSNADALDRLAAELASADAVGDPVGWGLAAHRLAVARSETANTADELAEAADLLRRAAAVLTPEGAPLEHARIRTALGSCARLAGRPDLAVDEFETALELGRNRFQPGELAAAHANLGLAHAECGRADAAIEVLGEGLDVAVGEDEDGRRVRGVLHLNRAQAFQHRSDRLDRAIADYTAAVELLPPGGLQQGMALHGLATAQLATGAADAAVASLLSALAMLTVEYFPLQHAIVRHSLAVAYERRSLDHDLGRALFHADIAVRTVDPRLHRAAWTTASDTLERVCSSLGISTSAGDRSRAFARLLSGVRADERHVVLRDHLGRLANLPDGARVDDLRLLVRAIATLDEPGAVIGTLVSVLMELPDVVLDEASQALVEAGAAAGPQFDRAVDDAVHDVLFGPQRVRIRDLLTSHGWVRP